MPKNVQTNAQLHSSHTLAVYGSHRVRHDRSNLAAAAAAHTSQVTLKILQPRLQQYVNQELPYVQVRFRKGRGTRDQIANIC